MLTQLVPWFHFDSELQPPPSNTPSNWTLTIRLRVKLMQRNSADTHDGKAIINDADGRPFWVLNWSTETWNGFCRAYEYLVQRFWHDRFWLRTPGDVSDLDWPAAHPTHRPNVLCYFDFQLSDVNWHYQIDAWRIRAPVFEGHAGSQFRSSSQVYDDRDLAASGGQITVLHEAGHLLGQEHEGVAVHDPTCMAAPSHNAQECYEPHGSHAQYHWGQSVMGVGMTLFPHHGSPWLKRINRNTPPNHGLRHSHHWQSFLQHHDQADRPRLLSELPALDQVDALFLPARAGVH